MPRSFCKTFLLRISHVQHFNSPQYLMMVTEKVIFDLLKSIGNGVRLLSVVNLTTNCQLKFVWLSVVMFFFHAFCPAENTNQTLVTNVVKLCFRNSQNAFTSKTLPQRSVNSEFVLKLQLKKAQNLVLTSTTQA